jgi:outer membrane protein OmpA-like peptidoglycan-associated protein
MAARYGVSDGLVRPYPGFRIGAGYELGGFRLSLESGYTYIKGENPLVLDIRLIPLSVKAGYAFSLGRLSLTPLLGAGAVFTSVNHYETAIAMLLDETSRSSGAGFLVNLGLRAGWSFVPALTLYAGGGVDCILETGGIIPLPSVELGITLKPFLFGKRPQPPAAPAPARPAEEPPAGAAVVIEEAAVTGEPELPPEEPEAEPEPVRVLKTLYFQADTAVPEPSYLHELDAAGELLRSSPALGVTLRGYTAPYATGEARRALSEARSRFCAGYLGEKYGVEAGRIRLEWHGADREPEAAGGEDWRRRCVEIIIETMANP